MALFDVPGWSMPSDLSPVRPNTRKRKRQALGEVEDKVRSAEVNFEKLTKRLERRDAPTKNRNKNSLSNKHAGTKNHDGQNYKKYKTVQSESRSEPHKRKNKAAHASPIPNSSLSTVETHDSPLTEREQNDRKGNNKKNRKKAKKTQPDARPQYTSEPTKRNGNDATSKLTPLQAKMRQSLDGARFRWVNEILYNSSGKDAERLMHEDANVFEEYHAGFRHQVASWPSNPVNHFIKTLSTYPSRTLIADLGCGDAVLAQSLSPKGLNVISYDLVSRNQLVIAADVCEKIPLPGARDEEDGQIADVVVCSLSLMNTNWLSCIREARRVLRTGGELKIAEVASRITNVEEFTSLIKTIGFRLVSKDESNTHFTLFDFKKSEGRGISDQAWRKLVPRSEVLGPCEYKPR